MGAAWCRNRAATASNSKSPIDRVLVQCVNQMCPSTEANRSTWNMEPEETFEKVKVRPHVSAPVPVHQQPTRPQRSHHIHVISQSSWQDASLSVPDSSPPSFSAPIPPPRKKRQLKITQQQEQRLENAWKRIARPPPPPPPEEPSSWPTSGEHVILRTNKSSKKHRTKSLSSVSLPNSHELSLALHKPAQKTSSSSPKNDCNVSTKGFSSLSTVEKIENCVRRCKSFGAFKSAASSFSEPAKGNLTKDDGGWMSSESDDSFDGLDDWDLRVIEHYDAPGEKEGQTTRTSLKAEATQICPPQRRRHSNNQSPADLTNGHLLQHSKSNGSVKITDAADERESILEECKKPTEEVTYHIDITSNSKDTPEVCIMEDNTNSAQQDCDKLFVFNFVEPKTTPHSELTLPPNMHNGFCKPMSDNPNGLKTPPPSPEGSTTPCEKRNEKEKNTANNESMDKEGEIQHSPLLRLLKEFRSSNTELKGGDLTNGLTPMDDGYLATKKDMIISSRCSSGRSSMTPSLSELEAALSDLLEASKTTGPDEDEDDEVHPLVANAEASSNSSSVPSMLSSNIRVISPKPFSTFTSSFHAIQNASSPKSEGHQHSQVSEAPA